MRLTVGEPAVFCDVTEDGHRIASVISEIIKQLRGTLVTVGVLFERIDNPDLTEVHSCSQGSGVGVTRDELDVLNTATLMLVSLFAHVSGVSAVVSLHQGW